MFEELLSILYKELLKNSEIRSVFAINKNEDFLQDQKIDYIGLFNSMEENISVLLSNEYYKDNENKSTKNIIEKARPLYNYLLENRKEVVSQYREKETVCKPLMLVNTACMIVLFLVTSQTSNRITALLDEELKIKKDIQTKNTYYRGHSEVSYKLLPSIYRNLKVDDGFSLVVKNTLYSLYSGCGMIKRYSDIFGSDQVDYNFCAFAQHSKAYSPFLDFTESHIIALAFATSNASQLNRYNNSEAALYSITFENELEIREDVSLGQLSALVINHKLNPLMIIRNVPLYMCTCKEFDVEAFILKDKTNDRMKYQRGCFLYFQRCVIVNDIVLLPITHGRVRKYIIPASGSPVTKNVVYNKICEKYPFYKYEYLMNPYKYFEEIPF